MSKTLKTLRVSKMKAPDRVKAFLHEQLSMPIQDYKFLGPTNKRLSIDKPSIKAATSVKFEDTTILQRLSGST